MSNPQATNDSRSAAIPTFDGKPPCRNQALTWLDAAKIFFAGKTDTVNAGQISGLATLAFRDIAAEWFRTEILQEEANGDASPDPKLCSSWAVFSARFKARFAAEDTSLATKQAELSALRMGHAEEIQRFRTRCVAAAIKYAPTMPAPPQETPANKQARLEFNLFARNEFACQYFVNGLIPVLQQRLYDKQYDNFEECVSTVQAIAKALVNQGKYQDPSAAAQPATKSSTQQGVNPQLTHPVLSAITNGSLATHLRQLGFTQSAAKLSSELQAMAAAPNPLSSGNASQPTSSNAAAIQKTRKNAKQRKHSPSDYTQGAKCSFCKKSNHTEQQCFAKKAAAKRQVSSIELTAHDAPQHEVEDLEAYFQQ